MSGRTWARAALVLLLAVVMTLPGMTIGYPTSGKDHHAIVPMSYSATYEKQSGEILGTGIHPSATGPSVAYTLDLCTDKLYDGSSSPKDCSGIQPYAAAYDGGKGEVFVADEGSSTVSVVSDTNDSVVTSTTVGTYPEGVAYDGGKGEVFVTNSGSNDVSVISDLTNSVVATIPVAGDPVGVAYDSSKGEVFVASDNCANPPCGDGTVSLISDSTNSVIATIKAGGGPIAVAYDSGKSEVFVANWGTDNVSVISDVTNSVVASIPVGYNPEGVTYDSGKGEVFVSNWGSNNVSVISDANNTVVATTAVGQYPVAMTYDTVKGEVFVANSESDTVRVISDLTNKVVATVTVGAYPQGVAYDSGKGEIFVPDETSDTVSVILDTNDTVVVTTTLGSYPDAVAYDSGKGEVFVANAGSNTVSVISNVTNSVVSTVPVGLYPDAAAYDGGKGEVFVANSAYSSNTVSVISDVTNSVVSTIPMGTASYPEAVAYDSGKGEVFVANSGLETVNVVSDSNNSLVATVAVGAAPWAVTYDSGKGEIFVADEGSPHTVSVISDVTNSVTATVTVGTSPMGVAYDSAKGEVFVANEYSDNVSVISDATNKLVATVPVGSGPTAVAYDSGKGEMFVPNSGSNNVSVISDKTNAVVASLDVGGNPSSDAYDSADHYVYLTNSDQGTLSIINDGSGVSPSVYPVTFTESGLATGTSWSTTLNGVPSSSATNTVTYIEPNGTYSFTVGAVSGYAANVTSGNLTVNGGAVARPITFTPLTTSTYGVSFTEVGLRAGTSWSVNLSGTTHTSATSTLTFSEPNGTYAYTLGTVGGYTPLPSSGNLTVKGANVTTGIAFTKAEARYSITFRESGLPSGTNWSVRFNRTVGTSTTSNIVITNQLNNTTGYTFTVGVVTGYASSPSSGLVVVNGANVTKAITFSRNSTTQRTYSVAFTESGLPVGTIWSVTFNGTPGTSSTSSIVFSNILNNTTGYAFTVGIVSGYTDSPSSGSVVVNGANKTESITFTAIPPGSYPVTFAETGLATGANWSVTLAGKTTSSSGSTISFTEKNGTYNYTVAAPTGYVANPALGSLTVTGKATSQSVTLTKSLSKTMYAVTFTESGLQSGTSWSVTFNGTLATSSTSSLVFSNMVNNTAGYTFTVGSVSGYTSNPSSGNVVVSGVNVTKSIAFTLIPAGSYSVTFGETGLPTRVNWSVTLSGKTVSTSGSSLTFAEKNGTYGYTVIAPTGYTATPSSGSLAVAGKAVSESLTFTKSSSGATYTVTFTESGLLSGTMWSVYLGLPTGSWDNQSSVTPTIIFQEPSGSYVYYIGSFCQCGESWTVSPSSGTLNVSGQSVNQTITFTSTTTSKGTTNQTTTFLGLPGDDGYILIGVVVAAVVILVTVVLIRKRKEMDQPSPSPPPAGPPPTP